MLIGWHSANYRNVLHAQSGFIRTYIGQGGGFSEDYVTAATATSRCPKALLEVTWGDRASDLDFSMLSNDVNRADLTGQLFNGETYSGHKWAYLGADLKADGSFYAMPVLDSEPQAGWFGSALVSDGAGDFSTEPYITLTHDPRPYSAITVVGDSYYNEYPVDFTITLTYPTGTYVIPVTGNTERIYITTFATVGDVTSVKLSISKWSAANTVVKIIQFSGVHVELYDVGDIIDIRLLEESNSDTGTVPIGNVSANEIDFSLVNSDRRFSYGNTGSPYNSVLLPGRKVRLWFGFVLPSGSTDVSGMVPGYIVRTESGRKVGYMPQGVFWSNDWTSSYDSMSADSTAYDISYRLSKKDFTKSLIYNGLAGDILNDLLTAAREDIPDLQWRISPDISGLAWSNVIFKSTNYLALLKDAMVAAMAFAYVDHFGVLIVGSRLTPSPVTESWQSLGMSDIFSFKAAPKSEELVNVIRVGYTSYTADDGGQELYPPDKTFTIPAGESSLSVYLPWAKKPVDISTVLLGITATVGSPHVSSYTIYANGADLTVSGSPGDSFTITATGTPYKTTEDTEVTARNQESVDRYGAREFAVTGNALITTLAQAQELADNLLTYYGGIRNDGSMTWPGNTLQGVGESLEVVEFGELGIETKGNFLIKRQTTTFNQGLRVETELRRSST